MRLIPVPIMPTKKGTSDGLADPPMAAGSSKTESMAWAAGMDAAKGTRHQAIIRRHIRSTYDITLLHVGNLPRLASIRRIC